MTFCLLAIMLNIVIVLITRYVDKEPAAPNFIPDDRVSEDALKEVPSILNRYGEISDDDIPDTLKLIDMKLMKYLSKYRKIEFDKYYTPVNLIFQKKDKSLTKSSLGLEHAPCQPLMCFGIPQVGQSADCVLS